MVSRAEIDMLDIKAEFLRMYGKTLASFIKVTCHYNRLQTLNYINLYYKKHPNNPDIFLIVNTYEMYDTRLTVSSITWICRIIIHSRQIIWSRQIPIHVVHILSKQKFIYALKINIKYLDMSEPFYSSSDIKAVTNALILVCRGTHPGITVRSCWNFAEGKNRRAVKAGHVLLIH